MRVRAKIKASFGPNLLKYFKPVAADRQESSPAASTGIAGRSCGGEPCLDNNGAGHGEPRLVSLVVGESLLIWSVRVRLVVSLVESLIESNQK